MRLRRGPGSASTSRIAAASASGSRARHQPPGAAVGPDHLGQRAGGVRDHRQAARHRLAGREAEALEEGGHDRGARRRVLRHELRQLEHAPVQQHAALEPMAPDQPHHEPVVRDAPVDDLERDLARQLRQRLEQRADPLLAVLGAPDEEQIGLLGHAGDGPEQLGVGAVVDDRDVLLGDPEVALDLAARGLAHGHDLVEALRDDPLHQQREVERALHLLQEGGVDREIGLAVDVQRMMDHRHHRRAGGADPEQAPGEALVVEHDVEAMPPLERAPAQQQAQREGLHLREHAEARDAELPEVEAARAARRVARGPPSRATSRRRRSGWGSRAAGCRGRARAAAAPRSRARRGPRAATRAPGRRRRCPARRNTCCRDR